MASEGFSDKRQPWQESNIPSNLLYSPGKCNYRPDGSRGMTEQQDVSPCIPELWNLFTR